MTWISTAAAAVVLSVLPRVAVAASMDQAVATAVPVAGAAQTPSSAAAGALERLVEREAQDEKQIQAQAALIQQQADELAKTKALLEQQQQELAAVKLATADLQSIRAGGMGAGAASIGASQIEEIPPADYAASGGSAQPTSGPVGEAPAAHPNAALALPLPQGINVLTPRGHFVFDNALEYQNSSSDRVVFAGIQIVNAIQIGELQANQTSNDTGILLNTFRLGLANNLEAELVVPWVARADRVTTVETVTPATDITHEFNIRGSGIGDVEGTLRYQLNNGANGWPIFVGAMRVVSNSGVGPFNVAYNDQGVALKLPTGSGFWVINPTVSVIYPLDPIVIFGAVGYQHSFGRDIDRMFGSGQSVVHIGNVQPGDSVSAAMGFAFSLNSRFSYSLGYKQSYFFPSTSFFLPTKNNIGSLKAETLALNDGVILAGASYRVNNHASINLNFEFGVTADAPNDTVVLRVPYLF